MSSSPSSCRWVCEPEPCPWELQWGGTSSAQLALLLVTLPCCSSQARSFSSMEGRIKQELIYWLCCVSFGMEVSAEWVRHPPHVLFNTGSMGSFEVFARYTKNQEIISTWTCGSPGMLMVPHIPLRGEWGDTTRTLRLPWVLCGLHQPCQLGFFPPFLPSWLWKCKDFDCRWSTGTNPMPKKE